jgi:MSHA biogenesis protein MshI
MNLQWPFFGAGGKGWTGFDAVDTGYCAVSVRNTSGKPQVVRYAQSSGMAFGADAIRELGEKVGSAGFPCTLALARTDYQVLVVPEPAVLESEMQASLRWSLASMIDYPPDEANIAWMRIPTEEYQPGHEKQVYAIVARNSIVSPQAGWFEEAKLPLKTVDIRETSLRNIALLLEKKNEGMGLLSFGPNGVTATFTFNGELYLDRFIAQPMDEIVEGDDQRRLKFFDRVAQQVYQSMELITRTHPFIGIERVVVGPTPVPMSLAQHLAGKLPVAVQLLDLSEILDLSATPELAKAENQARALVALGAALRGVRRSK